MMFHKERINFFGQHEILVFDVIGRMRIHFNLQLVIRPEMKIRMMIHGFRDRCDAIHAFQRLPKEDGTMEKISITNDFVTPTGGGYFFAPTIEAVREVLANPDGGLGG